MVSLPVGTNKASAQMLFLVWVTLTEHKWVILGECRGAEQHFDVPVDGFNHFHQYLGPAVVQEFKMPSK
jgi:hypothetical protein